METIQDGEKTVINRFGTATDPDEEWFGFECGETVVLLVINCI